MVEKSQTEPAWSVRSSTPQWQVDYNKTKQKTEIMATLGPLMQSQPFTDAAGHQLMGNPVDRYTFCPACKRNVPNPIFNAAVEERLKELGSADRQEREREKMDYNLKHGIAVPGKFMK